MKRLEKRVAAIEAASSGYARAGGTATDCCATFGYSLEQAIAEFGSFPAFCYALLERGDARQALIRLSKEGAPQSN